MPELVPDERWTLIVPLPMPERVQIGPVRYTISRDPAVLRQGERETGGHHNRGSCRPGRAEIVVSPDVPDTAARDTLLHEVLHGLNDQVNWVPQDQEEHACDVLSSVLLDTLRRNPDLVAYLTEGD